MRFIDHTRNRPGHWWCLICHPDEPVMVFGTFADWQYHYLTHHHTPKTEGK